MKESTRRVVFGIEIVLLALPVTVLFAIGLWAFSAHGSLSSWMSSIFVFSGVALFAFWHIAFAFLFGGSLALRELSVGWFAPPIAGTAWSMAAVVVHALSPSMQASWIDFIGAGAWGLPLSIPFLHVSAEALRVRTASNKRVQPTCEDARG